MEINEAIEILEKYLLKIKTIENLTSNNHFVVEGGQRSLEKAIEGRV